ncbi:biotin carboxylase [Paenibacillus forsythiae]|uniref:Biotin carboxylase n=1 Tax=Paenibacillus forsythiae TaxID=365616 RepID=A0ABU3HA23_9BACL|nr:ATP-grasp domain-containing protein [Paenibacillus forsythiae]MDT3427672.1 biotin carboxylase [Paenibacillus forsythiae]
MKSKRLFLLGIPETHIERAITRAHKLGMEVIVGDTPSSLEKYQHLLREADERVAVDYTNYDELFSVTQRIHQGKKLDAIFTFKEAGLYHVSKLQHEFKMCGNPPEVVSSCLDKYKTRQILKNAGLKSPGFALCKSVEEVYEFWGRHNHPVILKPNNQQGSIGVIKINSTEEIEGSFNECLKHSKDDGAILAEEFIDGKEISIEAAVYRNELELFGVTEKFLFPGTFVESGHMSPYKEENHRLYHRFIQNVIRILGITFGPLHIEAFHTKDDLVIGEVHTRYGGDNIVTITELAMDCDMHTPIFSQLADVPYTVKSHTSKSTSAIRFLNPSPGTVHSVEVVEDLHDLEGLVDFNIDCRAGDIIHPIKSSYDRVGWVLAKGSTRYETNYTLDQALEKIKMITK